MNEDSGARPMTPAERYVELLASEGFRPISEDRSVAFKFEGHKYVLEADSEDPVYVRLVLVFSAGGNSDALLVAANTLNARRKAVKTTVYDEGKAVLFTIESFYDSEVHLQPFLTRMLNSLKETSDEFFSEIAENDEDGRDAADDED